MSQDKEQEYQEEADRLALTPRHEQEAMVDWLKAIAADPKVRKADREEAGERAKALTRLLFRSKKSGKKNEHKP